MPAGLTADARLRNLSGMTEKAPDCLLRDDLAWRRTALANERTLLAYVRTSLATAAAGVTVLKFLETGAWLATGWLLVAGGVSCLLTGVWRYLRIRHVLGRPPSGAF
jgi:putative membrane protein